ncbi:MAG: peptidoglycan-binding protein [Actinomycetota bacterium]
MTTTIDHRRQRDHLAADAATDELAGLDLRTGRRWPYVLLGLAVGSVATIAVTTMAGDGSGDASTADTVQADLVTAQVTVQDLVEEVDWAAELTSGDEVSVVATSDATVTASAAAGSLLERGDVAFELDSEPVPVIYGELPLWRPLAEGDEGLDVLQLETNLVALGYDPDVTVTIDDDFTANTAAMVQRWQEDIGREVTGTVAIDAVVVTAGPVAVIDEATVGERVRAGEAIAALSTRTETATIVGRSTGTITELAALDEPVTHGTVLYGTDEVLVQAVTELDAVGALLTDPDADPVDVEAALVAAGYDPDGAVVTDAVYDDATVAAVELWQEATGLTVTGALTADAYVVVPDGLDVVERLVAVGDRMAAPTPVLLIGAPTMEVVLPVALTDREDFEVGGEVVVELPDESTVAGAITEVGAAAVATEPEGDLTVDVVVQLTDPVDEDLPASEVTVTVAGDRVIDAMVVPTRALVTLAEGGFAVEQVLADGTTVLAAVETGTFDDGVVEITSSQLRPGDDVVVPR